MGHFKEWNKRENTSAVVVSHSCDTSVLISWTNCATRQFTFCVWLTYSSCAAAGDNARQRAMLKKGFCNSLWQMLSSNLTYLNLILPRQLGVSRRGSIIFCTLIPVACSATIAWILRFGKHVLLTSFVLEVTRLAQFSALVWAGILSMKY